MAREVVVIKAGGSTFSKSEDNLFDFNLALQYKAAFDQLTKEFQFIWILGGGALCRKYQNELREFNTSDRDLDWVGVACNNLNATVMRVALGENAEENVLVNNQITEIETIQFEKDYLLIGGEKPGQTGDGAALSIALKSGAKKIFSFKNVDGVFSEDPRNNPNAKFYSRLSWDEYFGIIGTTEHTPGGHYPVDPAAAKRAKEHAIKFIVLNGGYIPNILNAIKGEHFKGTVVG